MVTESHGCNVSVHTALVRENAYRDTSVNDHPTASGCCPPFVGFTMHHALCLRLLSNRKECTSINNKVLVKASRPERKREVKFTT